jgi:hypothetical protein
LTGPSKQDYNHTVKDIFDGVILLNGYNELPQNPAMRRYQDVSKQMDFDNHPLFNHDDIIGLWQIEA